MFGNNKNLITICILCSIYIYLTSYIFLYDRNNYIKTNNKTLIENLQNEFGGGSIEESWGLGKKQTEYISNSRLYYWYIDQANTGNHSNDNCGPATATMASKWVDEAFDKTTEDARDTYKSEGGWWYTTDIVNYLNKNNIKTRVIYNQGSDILKDELKQGSILILCIDTTYINFNDSEEERVGRFYDYEGGHFIIVKGYRIVDDKLFFEVYDSNNWHKTYKDGQPMGKDRYYVSEELLTAISKWWDYLIVVHSEEDRDKNYGGGSSEVDINNIDHKYGK